MEAGDEGVGLAPRLCSPPSSSQGRMEPAVAWSLGWPLGGWGGRSPCEGPHLWEPLRGPQLATILVVDTLAPVSVRDQKRWGRRRG